MKLPWGLNWFDVVIAVVVAGVLIFMFIIK
jgi:hypothetical protein